VSAYSVVLYFHLLSLIVGIAAASLLVLCLARLRAADTLEAAAPWGMLSEKVVLGFPIAILGLFATGAYMTTDVWSWSTGWIVVGIAALVVLGVQGPVLGGGTAKKLEHALRENGPGPLGPHARRMARHPGLWISELANLGIVFGVVWNMTTKPGVAGAIAAVVVGYAVGVLLGLQMSRLPAGEAEPARATG
jgi:hypothetical protein